MIYFGNMKAAERQLKLQDLYSSQEFIDTETLCRKLDASESTIRRDLIELESRGILRRVHGGAISLQTRDEVMDLGKLSISCHEEKERIGKVAASMVKDGHTVILGGGSTTVEVARALFGRRIQVITHSIPVAQVFWDCKNVEVTLTGGYLYPRVGVQLGPICEQMLSNVAADMLIIGIAGITESGLSNSNTLIVGSERKMIEVSSKVIVVADHTKFGRNAMVHLAPLEVVDTMVSDQGLAPEYRELLNKHDIECFFV